MTKGSFYWHFTDLDAFLGAMAKHWEDGARIFRDRFTEMAQKDAKQTLVDAVNSSFESRLGRLERAMRDWSRSTRAPTLPSGRRTSSRSRRS